MKFQVNYNGRIQFAPTKIIHRIHVIYYLLFLLYNKVRINSNYFQEKVKWSYNIEWNSVSDGVKMWIRQIYFYRKVNSFLCLLILQENSLQMSFPTNFSDFPLMPIWLHVVFFFGFLSFFEFVFYLLQLLLFASVYHICLNCLLKIYLLI